MALTSHTNVISLDRVEATSVYSAASDKLGTIDDLVIDKAALEGAPRYASDRLPDYDEVYSSTINRYYGL